MTPLFTTGQMAEADRLCAARGLGVDRLMEAAGWQVARLARRHFRPRRVLVLCGPGNNGGDGFVAARLLAAEGWPVTLALLGGRESLSGAAARMAALWRGPCLPCSPALLAGGPLVVDALFGAGLNKPLAGAALEMVAALAESGLDVVAVDVPSGLDGNSGRPCPLAAPARLTVTFGHAKPGHLLWPGRELCGTLAVADIGIPAAVYAETAPRAWRNDPALWGALLPRLESDGHKYRRGHLLVAGGARFTGAARLAARAGRRAGAGLCTLLAPQAALAAYGGGDPGLMLRPDGDWPALLADPRCPAAVIGPGLGVGAETRALALAALAAERAVVLDADALTSFAADPAALWRAGGRMVLTPHDGEYARLFAHTGDRLHRARAAAAESGAVVLLKGPDTVVAAPDGRAAITADAPPSLATAGSGDVLAGIIGGLLAQGMPCFEAAAAGAWLHGRAAAARPPEGLIAEDVAEAVPTALAAAVKTLFKK